MQRCQRETTSTEFTEWQTYFRQESGEPRREEFYLAQISLEIRRIFAKHPARLKLEHFLFKFSAGRKAQSAETDLEARTAKSKQTWFALTGAGGGRTQTRTPPPQHAKP